MTAAEHVLVAAGIVLAALGMFAACNTDADNAARGAGGMLLLGFAVWLLLMGAT